MGTRILVALIYLYAYGCFFLSAAAMVDFLSLTTDASLGSLFYAIRWSAIFSGALTVCFALLILVSFVKKNWFRPLMVAAVVLSIVAAVGIELVTLRNVAALSLTRLTVQDIFSELSKAIVARWPFHGAEFLFPLLVWLYLYKLRPVDAYFAKFSEPRVLPNEVHP